MTFHLARLTTGLTTNDWAWLSTGEQLRQNVYLVENESASYPSPLDLPWPIILACGSYSLKHIFVPRRCCRKTLEFRIVDFSNRLKWAVAFELHPHLTRQSARVAPLLKRRVCSCTEVMPQVVTAFISRARSLILDEFRHLQQRHRPPPFVRFAMRWLRQNSLRAERSDKDGTFAIISENSLLSLAAKELAKPCYRAVGSLSLEAAARHVNRSLLRLARRAEVFCEPWGREIRRSACLASETSIKCGLQVTIKTHKVPVTVRLVHNSSMNVFNTLSGALNALIQPRVDVLLHVCGSSDQVADRLKGVTTGPRTILLKFDIKDFYLAGEHGFIVNGVSNDFEDLSVRRFVRESLETVLMHQYVAPLDPKLQDSTVYHMQLGSGIGMRHSGAVSDLLFHREVERDLLLQRKELGIVCYLRYRDDILAVLSDISYSIPFREKLVGLAGRYCVVELEKFSLVGVPFLDFLVHKADPEGPSHLVYRPHIKPTARHIPLSSASYHAPSVHRSWPLSEIHRMYRRSASLVVGRCWAMKKVNRFKCFFLSPKVIATCEAYRGCTKSKVARSTLLVRPSPCDRVVRAILPFRRELMGLPRRFEQLCSVWKPSLLHETRLALDFKVCWSSGGRNLRNLLRTA